MFLYILSSISEDLVVHQLEEILLRINFRPIILSLLSIDILCDTVLMQDAVVIYFLSVNACFVYVNIFFVIKQYIML